LLQHSGGFAADDDATAGHVLAKHEEIPEGVDEVEVERKAHAEGMDAGAAREEEAAASLLAVEPGEAEQTSAKSPRQRNPMVEDGDAGQAREPRRDLHANQRPATSNLSPLPTG
jgi:hypothetical protein